jgi:hypothetical protein
MVLKDSEIRFNSSKITVLRSGKVVLDPDLRYHFVSRC